MNKAFTLLSQISGLLFDVSTALLNASAGGHQISQLMFGVEVIFHLNKTAGCTGDFGFGVDDFDVDDYYIFQIYTHKSIHEISRIQTLWTTFLFQSEHIVFYL